MANFLDQFDYVGAIHHLFTTIAKKHDLTYVPMHGSHTEVRAFATGQIYDGLHKIFDTYCNYNTIVLLCTAHSLMNIQRAISNIDQLHSKPAPKSFARFTRIEKRHRQITVDLVDPNSIEKLSEFIHNYLLIKDTNKHINKGDINEVKLDI